MEVRLDIFLIILGAALVTFIPRVLPLMLLSRITIPGWGMRWLNYMPIAVMSALIAQELFIDGGRFSALSTNVELIAALPTFWVAVKTRSLLGTVITGVISLLLLRLVF
ncbi:AzlD domain-containing protein [Paenibacillus sp. FSL R7-0331]|uniref:AzlD domain-containing protein n=1 Tax=Paenibacillus sp. FSL R7-0331 TaxID=1536773 RepID=UPI0004F7AB9C|nr:AzlD domain-containing protein [Paenibacillus sp. FSL R7-0331]AIQ52634.1 branched-chain amino acid ABC transporter [Paenibacillus sp. FSL R7-0331]